MRISILGDQGQMGFMLSSRLQAAGYDVLGIDLPFTENKIQESIQFANIIILCIPSKFIHEISKKIAPYIPKNAILMDITSVKILPMKNMEEFYSGPVVGTHPLFGPRSQEHTQVCLCQGSWFSDETTPQNKKNEVMDTVNKIFTDINCSTFVSTAEEHDQAMGAIQGLNFVTNVAYFAMTANMKNISPFLTPSFLRRLDSARTLINNDGELFMGLFDANPMSQNLVRQYRSFLNVAAGGDMNVLLELAKKWFTDENNKPVDESSHSAK